MRSRSPGCAGSPCGGHSGSRRSGSTPTRAATSATHVVEDHDETGGGAGGHEEVYAVIAGRARFTVAGDELDAPAGTLVFVRDPAARRLAVAEEAADDGSRRRRGPRRGILGLAVGVVVRRRAARCAVGRPWGRRRPRSCAGLAEQPENASLLYNLACFESLAGRRDEAIEHLTRAAELDPKAAAWADGDTDLDSLRERPDFPF